MRRLTLALLVLLLACGCASFRKPQEPPKKAPRPDSPYVLYVEPTVRVAGALDANTDVESSVKQNLALDLQKSLYKRILATPERTAPIVTDNYDTLWTYLQTGKTVYQISCTLTNYEKGNGLLRYLLGDWPTWYSDDYVICDYMAGYVALQADCTVTDLGKKTQVLQFSATEKFSGNPHGGLNFFVFSPNYVAGKTTRRLADQLITKLADQL